MIYYALLQGLGEGCDYTIGCNLRYEKLEVDNLTDAKRELNKLINNLGGINREDGWKEIILLECTKEINKIIPNREWDDE
jgi:hypothetical protein